MIPNSLKPFFEWVKRGREDNRTDRAIYASLNERLRELKKAPVVWEWFDGLVKKFSKIPGFPLERKPIDADKWLKERRLQGGGSWSPETQAGEIERDNKEFRNTWTPNPRNPIVNSPRFDNRVKYSERVGEELWINVGQSIKGPFYGLPECFEEAKKRQMERYIVTDSHGNEIFSSHNANFHEREFVNHETGETEQYQIIG